jgi:hypothetical protein
VVPFGRNTFVWNHETAADRPGSKLRFLSDAIGLKGTTELRDGAVGRGRCPEAAMFRRYAICLLRERSSRCSFSPQRSEGESIAGEGYRLLPRPHAALRNLRLRLNAPKRTSVPKRSQRAYFSSDRLGSICQHPPTGRSAMSKQIFDQDRPRSTMARLLDEAFAGCDQWTVVSAPPRRSSLDFSPRSSSSSRIFDRAAAVPTQEPRAL